MDKLGGGYRIVDSTRVIITGNSKVLPVDDYEVINKTNYTNLNFILTENNIFSFDETTGIFTFNTSGLLDMIAVLNIEANQASAILKMISEFDFGSGWVCGTPRKRVLVAIAPAQINWYGQREIYKGMRARFCFKGESGNLQFVSEILDQGGPLEVVLPAAIFYLKLSRIVISRDD